LTLKVGCSSLILIFERRARVVSVARRVASYSFVYKI
jgi:hypothetical protein